MIDDFQIADPVYATELPIHWHKGTWASPGLFKLTTRHWPIIFGLGGLESGAIDVCVQNKIRL